MNVVITEKSTGKSIGAFRITLGGALGRSENEYFDEAWRCAIEDGLVDPNERTAYNFKLIVE